MDKPLWKWAIQGDYKLQLISEDINNLEHYMKVFFKGSDRVYLELYIEKKTIPLEG